ncbi:MAG: PAP/fibrillin family protein [Promethearchaeia archaeon]
MQPANDITYLDDTLRITRGGDDSLFIFRREEGPRAMLSPDSCCSGTGICTSAARRPSCSAARPRASGALLTSSRGDRRLSCAN